MMKQGLLFILFLLLLSACDLRPLDILAEEQMEDILLDIHLVEASVKSLDQGATRIERQEYYYNVFVKYGITKADFDRSIDWYSRDPERFVELYERVKVKAEDLQKRVEAYEFHMDEKPTHADSVSTFDLWHWERDRLLALNEDSLLAIDSLHFCINDSNYLTRAESYHLYLKMRVYSPDSVEFATRLVLNYGDLTADTLQYVACADSVCRRYNFTKNLFDDRRVESIGIELVDSARTIERVMIDSVEFNKVYNKYLYPIGNKVRSEVNSANDSIAKSKGMKVK